MSNGVLFPIIGILGLLLGIGASQLLVEPEPRPETRNRVQGTQESSSDESAEPALSSRELESALESAAGTVDYGPLDGKITGRVLDVDGNPVPGVKFTARPRAVFKEDHTPVEAARAALDHFHRSEALMRTATSNESGEFVLPELGTEKYRVTARASFAILRNEGNPPTSFTSPELSLLVDPGEELVLTAHPAASVRFTVLDPTGQEPSVVYLDLSKGSNGSGPSIRLPWTPTKRELLTPDVEAHGVSASGPDFTSESVTVDPIMGERVEVELQLNARHSLRGQVFQHNDRLLREGVVRIGPANGSEPPEGELPTTAWIQSGSFQFADLEAGDYWITANSGWDSDSRGVGPERVTVEGRTLHTLQMPPPDLSQGILLYARASDGTPVTDLEFSQLIESGNRTSSGSASAQPTGDGGYYLSLESELRDQARSSDVSITIHATSEQYGTQTVELSADELGRVDLEFEPAAYLNVLVTDIPATAASRLKVTAVKPGDRSRNSNPPKDVPLDGRVKVGPISPGATQLRLLIQSSQNRWSTITIAAVDLEVATGSQEATVSVPDLYPLTIQFPSNYSGRHLNLSGSDLDLGDTHVRISEDGVVHFDALPAGTYRLEVFAGAPEMMSVTVPQDSQVDFKADIVNALEVTIIDPDHPIAQKGFQTGDLIIAIDGQTFEGSMAMQGAMMSVMNRDEVPVTVVRGANEFELQFPASSMMRDMRGARVRPATR